MRRIVVLTTFMAAIVVPSTLFAQQARTELELVQLEKDWCNAQVKNDPAALARILADDVTLIGASGVLRTKAEALARVKANKVSACDNDLIKVRVYGDTAVVTGRNTATGVDATAGPFTKDQVMWTDTFVRRDGRWLCVATQSSPIKK